MSQKTWEQALLALQDAEQQLCELRQQSSTVLSQSQREEISRCSHDVAVLWNQSLSIKDRKEITRLLVKQVTVAVQDNSQRVDITAKLKTSFATFSHCERVKRSDV